MQQAVLTKFLWSIKKLCAVYFSVYKSQRDLYVENDNEVVHFWMYKQSLNINILNKGKKPDYAKAKAAKNPNGPIAQPVRAHAW